VPGIYHVATRTVDKRDLSFADDYGRIFFLDLIMRVVARLEWICWAYVLMGTHYHLIVDTPKANLSLGMQFLNGTYAQRYNKVLRDTATSSAHGFVRGRSWTTTI
jgi:putative transposase